jgi:hypothetical protein
VFKNFDWKDAIERVVWTAIQVGGALLIVQLTSGAVDWEVLGIAVAIAVLKVVVAFNVGDKSQGSIP